jgi:hypothetical protein
MMAIVMNVEKHVSFHVLRFLFNLYIFGIFVVTCWISTCLTICHNSKFVPQRRYNQGYLGYTLEECMSEHFSPEYILGVITRNSFRPEPSFRPKTISICYIVTQALVPLSVTLLTVNPTVALHEVTPAESMTMNVLFICLALFRVKSGWAVCQVHGFYLHD